MRLPPGCPGSAGIGVTLALLTACLAHPVYEAGPLGRPTPPRPATVRMLVFGDFGHDTLLQRRVAGAIRREAGARPFDLAVELGDDLYFCGPDPLRAGADACAFAPDGATVATFPPPPDDPAFAENERPLEGLRARDGGPLRFYLALGNHDVGLGGGRCARPGLAAPAAERRRACLSVAHRGPAWTMPARHYVVERGPVRVVVIDTNVVERDYGGFTLDDELAFVRDATAPCATPGRICFLAGHHPPAAAIRRRWGYRGASSVRMGRVIAAAKGVRAFLAGHVHSLQHLSLPALDVFVSGSTAMGGPPGTFDAVRPASAQVRFATTAWGFAVLEADAGGYRVRFVDDRGDALHCCEAGADGPCRPVACE